MQCEIYSVGHSWWLQIIPKRVCADGRHLLSRQGTLYVTLPEYVPVAVNVIVSIVIPRRKIGIRGWNYLWERASLLLAY